MSDADPNSSGMEGASPRFTTTHWTLVLKAGQNDSPQATEALEWLCRTYRYPLYAYVRRQGQSRENTQDLVQEFFYRLLERDYLRRADPNRGRFRTFLLTSLKNFLINEWNKSNREKRGGGRRVVSLDEEDTETRFLAEPADERTPDKAFDRQWAKAVLDLVMDRLQTELMAEGRGRVFEELKSFLIGEDNDSTYAVIGERLGMTAGNVKVTVHRLRRRYLELLTREISKTVDGPEAVEDEIRHLFAALSD